MAEYRMNYRYRIVRLKNTLPGYEDEIYLSLEDSRKTKPSDFMPDEVVEDPATGLTASDVAEVLAAEAENGNYHDFVSSYEVLCNICIDKVGEGKALEIMNEIAKIGGLHG